MNKSPFYFLPPLFLFFLIGISLSSVKAEDKVALNIYTVNYPIKFFAETIAKQYAKVTLPMPADIDPAFWSPRADDIINLQKADLILLNGANYAKWLSKVSLPLFKQVNTSAEFRDDYINLEEELKHNHGSGGEHSHSGTAFTTWLDFSLAEKQAKAVFKALSEKEPDLKSIFLQNFIPLQKSLLGFDGELMEVGAALKDVAFLGSHPVYQYLKKRYQLNLKSVHWEPEEAPTEKQWNQLQKILSSHPAKWMLWEAEPALETVAKLEELGVKSIVFSPCANVPKEGGFLTVMRKNIDRLKITIKK
jgi:zinc transport system substrate-binding protein